MIVDSFSVSRELVVKAIDECLQALIRTVEKLLCGRLAGLKVAAAAAIIAFFTNFPPYNKISDMRADIQAVGFKSQHPFSPIPLSIKESESHIDKMELRLTVPILGWLSRTGQWTVMIWSPLLGITVFYLLTVLATKALSDEVGGALFVLGIAPTFFGGWFFSDFLYGDAVAFLFLLFTIASRSALLSFGCFVVAAFCDERSVTALPLLIVYLMLRHNRDSDKSLRRKLCLAIVVGAVTWWLLRSWAASAFHLTTGTSEFVTWKIFRQNVANCSHYVLFSVFKASWTLPLFAISSLILLRKWKFALVFAGAFALAMAPAFLVLDFDRSVCYTFVILLVSLYFLWGDRSASRRYLAAILIINCLLVSRETIRVFTGLGKS
jgi:hypothetical protein